MVDINALFNELGFALPSGDALSAAIEEESMALMSIDDIALADNNIPAEILNEEASLVTLTNSNSLTAVAADSETVKVTSAPGAMGQADIVFIIDTTGSMYSAISNVKNNIGYFVDTLKSMGVSAAFGLVEYRDITVDGYNSTKVYKDGNSNWFYDIEKYKAVIGSLYASGGGDGPECAIDALETARLLDMRASAGKFFILVTDANYKLDNRYDIPTMAYEIELLKNAGVCASVVTPDYYKYTYEPLYQETGGIWTNIYGNFHTELLTLAYRIGEVVGDGYWIYLNGPVPVPIRLDEEPYEGSTVDTDGDGIYDVEELESIEPTGEVDLDEIIRIVSKGAITGTNYGVVKTYNCNSMPTTVDTDYDGIDDGLDMEPKNNTFKVVMEDESYDIDANVSYTMDLRTFFGDNEKFNKNLCVTSSLFSACVYEGITIEGKHADGLLEKHGFKDVDVYKLSESYSDEHLSEIAIGHKPVWYNDQKREIVAVIVRGTDGSIEEWSSNFDVGHTDEVGGDWVEWVNHKGFDIVATRILRYITQYVEDNSLGTSSEIVFWVSGHSRGAAIANIIGARLGYKAFTYTFAAPNTTMDPLTSLHKGIFNIVNSDDFVSYLPMDAWGFGRYGKTARISLGDNYAKEWEDLTGKWFDFFMIKWKLTPIRSGDIISTPITMTITGISITVISIFGNIRKSIYCTLHTVDISIIP